jgi:hypothetical protein
MSALRYGFTAGALADAIGSTSDSQMAPASPTLCRSGRSSGSSKRRLSAQFIASPTLLIPPDACRGVLEQRARPKE